MLKFILPVSMLISVSVSAQNAHYKVLHKDEDKSSIEIIQNNETGMKGAVTNETTYKYFAAEIIKDQYDYFAKIKTKTLRYFSAEGQQSLIAGEIYSSLHPQKPLSKFSYEADDVHFNSDDYLTVKYGCCASPNEVAVYDYAHKQIVSGDNNILIADINSERFHTNIYSGLKSFYEKKDTLGVLVISYSAQDKYTIYLLSKKKSSFCNQYEFDYKLQTGNTETTVNTQFDGLLTYLSVFPKNVNAVNQINNLEYIIEYQCMAYGEHIPDGSVADKKYTAKIPIVNGKPFGKSDSVQILHLEID